MLDTTAEIIYLTGVILGSIVRGVSVKRSGVRRRGGEFSRVESVILFFVSLGMFVIPMLFLFSSWLDFANFSLPAWLSLLAVISGGIVFLLAIWLLWRTHADLAENFAPGVALRENHQLVTTGVFSRMRHPMYSAHLLWSLAQALLLHNWIAGFSMIITQKFLLIYRIPKEESRLEDEYGETYRAYAQKTWRFFPKLY